MLNECHGLDPAGPNFDGCPQEGYSLNRNDCKLVQTIHTSSADVGTPEIAAALTFRWGSNEKRGHCDFWVNCGRTQGPCTDPDIQSFLKGISDLFLKVDDAEVTNYVVTRLCSHWKAPLAYLSELRKDCNFNAYPCAKCSTNFTSRACFTKQDYDTVKADNNLPPYSKCSPSMNTNYYVATGSRYPFCTSN